MQLPTHQNAAVKKGEGHSAKCQVTTIPVPRPGPGQILCKINYSGICGTDRGFFYDEFAARGAKMHESAMGISGHEGAGVVVAVADDVKELWKEGDRVGIKWVVSVCRKCEFCTNGVNELQCPEQLNSGYTVPGTFQEYCLTDARYASRLPDGVKDEEAGPILCGGVTAYTACRRSQVRAGQWIVLIGAGGGLGHMAIQYAKVMGMRIIAVDGGTDKEKLCLSLGAEHFIDYTSVQDISAEIRRITTYGAHGVAVFATSSQGYAIAPFLLRPGGTVVAVGIPTDPNVMAGAPPGILATRSLNVVGAVTGTLKQVDEALDFVARGLVKPNLIHGTLHDIDEMFDKMGAGQLAGRAVIKKKPPVIPILNTGDQTQVFSWAEQNGVTLKLMENTMSYWRDHYSWRSEETRLNRMPQYMTSIEVDDFGQVDLHFVHSLSSSSNAIPLLFLHGWPGSFQEVSKALPNLTAAGFHVVAPSLPGFGFSSCPNKAGFTVRQIAELMHKLMSRLHYRVYVVQGGDWGAMVAWIIAHLYPDSAKGIHVNLLAVPKPDFGSEPEYTEFEKRSLQQHKHFDTEEFAYYLVQNTKPRTFGFAMHDSPVGMLAWMADKLFTWSDSYSWSRDELVTWTLLHYFPGPTGGFQIYRENSATEMISGAEADRFLQTPTGVSAFAKEAEMVPRSWAEKKANVVFWQEHGSGGHFAAYEKPEEFVDDLVRFFPSVWKQ